VNVLPLVAMNFSKACLNESWHPVTDEAVHRRALPGDLPIKVRLPEPIMTTSALSSLMIGEASRNPVQPQSCEESWNCSTSGWTSAVQPSHEHVHLRPSQEKPSKHLVKEDGITLVVRNIPEGYSQERLLLEWPHKDDAYNLLYMPKNSTKGQGASHAFLNFPSADAARAFKNKWHGKHLKHTTDKSMKLNVSTAKVQGSCAILALLKKRRVGRMQSQSQPKVFKDGIPVCWQTALAEADEGTKETRIGGDLRKAKEETRIGGDTCVNCTDNGSHSPGAHCVFRKPHVAPTPPGLCKMGRPDSATTYISPAPFPFGVVLSL